MKSSDEFISPEIVERLCQSAAEPLALFDAEGKLLSTNKAMDAELASTEAPTEILESFCRYGAIDSDVLSSRPSLADELQLVKLRLGEVCIVALTEQRIDSRIERLLQRLELAEKRSITDRLTGVWNRQHFEQVAEKELSRSQRYGDPVCLALVDIDHFKRVNDNHCHSGGDQVLKELVTVVQSRIRVVDSLFRWGGEEFAVLLPQSSLAGARLLAQRLVAAVAEHDFMGIGSITVSIGVAELEPDEDAESWFHRADQALYQAKKEGRNRVVCAMPAPSAEDKSDIAVDEVVFLPWKAGYECGHALIDSQHQQLFVLGSGLIAASLDENTTAENFLGLIDELIAHVSQHFADEEKILASVGYAELAAHSRAHAGLVNKARALRAKAENGTARSSEVIDFLVNSVVKNHMLTADKAFFEHLVPDQQAV